MSAQTVKLVMVALGIVALGLTAIVTDADARTALVGAGLGLLGWGGARRPGDLPPPKE